MIKEIQPSIIAVLYVRAQYESGRSESLHRERNDVHCDPYEVRSINSTHEGKLHTWVKVNYPLKER